MSRDGGTLESLEGLEDVDQDLLLKLKEFGIESISSLATTTAPELLEDYYSNYDNAASKMSIVSLCVSIFSC